MSSFVYQISKSFKVWEYSVSQKMSGKGKFIYIAVVMDINWLHPGRRQFGSICSG